MNIYIFSKPLNKGVQTYTEFQKLKLEVNGLSIQFTKEIDQNLPNVIKSMDHLVFPPGGVSSDNLNYFVTLSGDLTNPKSASLVIYKD